MRRCPDCGQEKEDEQYYPRQGKPAGYCRDCDRARQKRWRSNSVNKDHKRKQWNEWRRNNPDKHHAMQLRTRFGIQLQDYQNMMEAQSGVCGICGGTPPSKRRLAVDHDHTTGLIRGLLCYGCNANLGVLEDTAFVEKAHQYLQVVAPKTATFVKGFKPPRTRGRPSRLARGVKGHKEPS